MDPLTTGRPNPARGFLARSLGLAVMTPHKVGSRSLGHAFYRHPQFEVVSIAELAAAGVRRFIGFTRPTADRLDSAWRTLKNGFKDRAAFDAQVNADPYADPHTWPQRDWMTFNGQYLPTETHDLARLTEVVEGLDLEPPVKVGNFNKR